MVDQFKTETVVRRPPRGRMVVAVLAFAAALAAAWGVDSTEEAESATAPMNVVVIVSDDQPLRSIKAMPYMRRAQDDGWTRFADAVVNNPLCCPSRATLLTGLYSHNHGVEKNSQASSFDDTDTLATWLDDAGYETAFVGKYLNGYPWDKGGDYVPPGWDRWIGVWGRPGYYDYTLSYDGRLRRFGSRPAHYLGRTLQREALGFLDQRAAGTGPFFLLVGHYGPHNPAIPEPRDEGRYRHAQITLAPNVNEENVRDKPGWVRRLRQVGEPRLRERIRRRNETLISVDRMIRNVVARLRATGGLTETLLLFTTDNGYAIGEHRHNKKGCVYEECIRVPLYVRYPDSPPGLGGVNDIVSNADLAPTIAEAAGVRTPPQRDGTSLLPLLEGRELGPSRAVPIRKADPGGASPRFWGVRTARFKYAELASGERELYDLRDDPYELNNLAGKRRWAALQRDLRSRLAKLKP